VVKNERQYPLIIKRSINEVKDMDYLEVIEQRRARRSYLETPVDKEKLDHLSSLIKRYNEEADLSITLVLDGTQAFGSFKKSYGMFKNVRSLIALIGKKQDPNQKEKLGYYGELLVLEATNLGLGTCWVGGTFDRGSKFVDIKQDEELVCVIPIGNIGQEKTFKEKLIHKMSHRKSKSIEELFKSDSPIPQWFMDGMKAVQKAPSAFNLQPVKFEYKNGKVTAFVEDTRFLTDLGIAKAHFSLTAGGSFEFGNHGDFHKPPPSDLN
jgi:nitroreductase